MTGSSTPAQPGVSTADLMAALSGMRSEVNSMQDLFRAAKNKTAAAGASIDTRGIIARLEKLEISNDLKPSRTDIWQMMRDGAPWGSPHAQFAPPTPAIGAVAGDNDGGCFESRAQSNADIARTIRQYARTGEINNLNSTVGTEGGFLVVPQYADAILTKLFDVSPIARLATRVMLTEGTELEIPIGVNLPGAQWVGENETRSVQSGPTFGLTKIHVYEIYALVKISQILLADSHYDLDAFLTNAINQKFATSIGAAFINGNTPGAMPTGILRSPFDSTDDEVRAWNTLQYVPSGASGAFVAAPNSGDCLIDISYKLRAPYRSNARWFMNRKTAAVVRKMKDSDGRFLWADGLAVGQPDRLLGYPVELDEQLPDIAANSYSILFGDMAQAWTMPMRGDVSFLRDPFTEKGQMLLYATARVGGALVNSEAIKALKFSAS